MTPQLDEKFERFFDLGFRLIIHPTRSETSAVFVCVFLL